MQIHQASVTIRPADSNEANSDVIERTPRNHEIVNNTEEAKDNTDGNGENNDDDDIPSVATEQNNDSDDSEDGETPQNIPPNDPFHESNWEVYQPLPAQIAVRETRAGIYYDGLVPPLSGHPSSSGPIRIPVQNQRESQYLELLFTDETLERFVQQSNEFNWNQQQKFWKSHQYDLTVPELKKFFAVVLYMGIHKLPNRDMYWRKYGPFKSDFVRKCFTKNRFDIICKVLHYTDTSTLTIEERRQLNRENPYWTVDAFIHDLARNFQAYFSLGRQIDVDEMCIPFKGRFKALNYNPKKPAKWHIKGFGLNDSKTGYLYNFCMYGGRNEQRPEGLSATVYPVVKLINPDIVHNKILACDNWYTSMLLIKKMKSNPYRGIEYVGTTKVNTKGIPKAFIFPKSGPRKRPRGTIESHRITVDNITYYFTCWMDKKPVHLLSTIKPEYTYVNRKEKNGNGEWEIRPIKIPTLILLYNKSMGGTDLFDQFGSYYRSTLKSVKWHIRLISHFFVAACINANILYQGNKATTAHHNDQQLKFMVKIIDQWSGFEEVQDKDQNDEDEEEAPIVVAPSERTEYESRKYRNELIRDWETRVSGIHTVQYVPNNNRKYCTVCRQSRTRHMCLECNVYCHVSGETDNNCWHTLHTHRKF